MDSSRVTPSGGFGFSSGAGAAPTRDAATSNATSSHCFMTDLLPGTPQGNQAGASTFLHPTGVGRDGKQGVRGLLRRGYIAPRSACYSVGPMAHGANSSSPTPLVSL